MARAESGVTKYQTLRVLRASDVLGYCLGVPA